MATMFACIPVSDAHTVNQYIDNKATPVNECQYIIDN